MSKGVNKAILIGSIGQDPEVKYTQSGACVTNIRVATNSSYTDKTSGQKVENVEWHRVVFFNKLAEIAAEYLRKGSQVYVEGSLRTRKWQDQQGQDRYTTEIVGDQMQMLGSRSDQSNDNHAEPQARQNQQSNYSNQAPNRSETAPQGDSFDDDIPF